MRWDTDPPSAEDWHYLKIGVANYFLPGFTQITYDAQSGITMNAWNLKKEDKFIPMGKDIAKLEGNLFKKQTT